MKKKVISIIICILLASSLYSADLVLEKQLDYVKEVLTNCSIGIEEAVESGFDLDSALDLIRKEYLSSSLAMNRLEKEDLLAELIFENIWKKTDINDMHFAIATANKKFIPDFYRWFYSNIFFENRADGFYVISSDNKSIKKGQKYTGDKNFMFKCFYNNMEAYRYGVFTNKYIKEAEISIENNLKNVKVNFDFTIEPRQSYVNCIEMEKSVYVSIGDCFFQSDDIKKSSELENNFKQILRIISNNNYENIIIDLRSNVGGYFNTVKPIIPAIYCKNNNSDIQKIYNKIDFLLSGAKELNSYLLSENYLQYVKSHPALIEDDFKNAEAKMSEMLSTNDKFVKIREGANKIDIINKAFDGKIIFITNKLTSSAAEQLILLSYVENTDKIFVIGDNSLGSLDYTGQLGYQIPGSGISMYLTWIKEKDSLYLKDNSHWHGDGYGIYPDFWTTSKDLLNVIEIITGDKQIKKNLKGLNKNLL